MLKDLDDGNHANPHYLGWGGTLTMTICWRTSPRNREEGFLREQGSKLRTKASQTLEP